MAHRPDLLPGTLDLLILKALSLGVQHGYGVLLRINLITAGGLQVEQGALYRLETAGLIQAEWGVSGNNRRAKFYKLTAKGRKRLGDETTRWNNLVSSMAAALSTRPEEA